MPGAEAVHHIRSITVGMAIAPLAKLVDRDAMPDAGDHVLQQVVGRDMEEHIVGDDGRYAERCRELRQVMQPQLVVRAAAQGQREISAPAKRVAQGRDDRTGLWQLRS